MFSVTSYAGFAAGGTRAITPPNTPGLNVWLDFSDASSITMSGSNISSIVDKSTNTHTYTSTAVSGGVDATARPTVSAAAQNSLSAMQCAPDSNHGLPYVNSLSVTSFAGFTVVAAAQIGAIGGGDTYIGYLGNNLVELRVVVSPPVQFSYDFNGADSVGCGSGVGGAWHVFSFGGTAGTQTMNLDGGASSVAGTGTHAVNGTDNFSRVGYRSSGNIANAATNLFGEIRVFGSKLSLSDFQKEEGYLAWKWGLQGSLPSNHPYKNAPP